MKNCPQISALLAAFALAGGHAAFAQTPPPPPPPHQGMLHNLFHRPHPGQPMNGHMMPGHSMHGGMMPGHSMGGMMGGSIIGNKNSHVYHMAGDPGALPAPQNRVYFRSAAEAEAAGFRRAGGGAAGGHHMMRPRMHGSPTMGTPGMMHP